MSDNLSKSMSIRAKINNFAKANNISPQHALQSFFAERFLARVSASQYATNLAVKEGTLMSALLGIAQRTTMDVDVTVIGMHVDEEVIKKIVTEIAAIDVKDNIVFEVDLSNPGVITKDDDYGGYSISMHALLGTIRLPISVDLTFGDIITPKAETRTLTTLLDDNIHIQIFAYTVETLIAEKLQTVLHRGEMNTRPRDFYDLYMLLQKGNFDWETLHTAVANTFKNRHSEQYLLDWQTIVATIAESDKMKREWARYKASAKYASNIDFHDLISAVETYFTHLVSK